MDDSTLSAGGMASDDMDSEYTSSAIGFPISIFPDCENVENVRPINTSPLAGASGVASATAKQAGYGNDNSPANSTRSGLSLNSGVYENNFIRANTNNSNSNNKAGLRMSVDSSQQQYFYPPPLKLARSESFRDDMDPNFCGSTKTANTNTASTIGGKHSMGNSAVSSGGSGSGSLCLDRSPETPAKKRKESKFLAAGLLNLGPKSPPRTVDSAGAVVPSRFHTDFVLQSFMGTGTFGTVMRVRNKMSNVEYAVKKSRRPFVSKSDRQLMLQEVGTMAELSAAYVDDDNEMSHIVRYYDGWIEDEHVFLQMELCEISVEAMLNNYTVKLDTKEIYRVLRHVFLGLKFVHSRGLVHLDIKPGNILKKRSMYKISDFGLSVHTNKGKASTGAVEEGDSRYLAKEMLDWAPVENLNKCDIFSVGMTAFELVSGKQVPSHGEQWQTLRNNQWRAPESCSSELADILSTTLNSDPTLRPSAEEALSRHVCLMSDIERELHYQKLRVAALTGQLEDSKHAKPRLKRHHSVV